MESSSRGQLPARHTKVVDEDQRPLNTGSLGSGLVCINDSKPSSQGRDMTDESQTGDIHVCRSVRCGSKRCKT